MSRFKFRPTVPRVLALGYMGVILLGSFLLCLPISAKSGEWTPFINALFTSTSATCVTGLITYDTFLHWSVFGQIVVILLIQVGGIGFMTVVTLFSFALGRRIGLYERIILAQSAGAMGHGGVVKLVKRIIIFTFSVELAGALLLMIRFIPDYGAGRGIWFSVFHSISAFCNAGFDLMGVNGTAFSSLTMYVGDPLVNLTICALIVIGGMGYVVWSDIWDKKFRYKKYRLHTRIVLWSTLILVFLPALLIFIFERNGVLVGLGAGAYSKIGLRRFHTAEDTDAYISGNIARITDEEMTESSLALEKVVFGLRTRMGAGAEVLTAAGIDREKLLATPYFTFENNALHTKDEYLLISDGIIVKYIL